MIIGAVGDSRLTARRPGWSLPPEQFPRMHELFTATYDFDLDDVFEAALTTYLDGLARQVEG